MCPVSFTGMLAQGRGRYEKPDPESSNLIDATTTSIVARKGRRDRDARGGWRGSDDLQSELLRGRCHTDVPNKHSANSTSKRQHIVFCLLLKSENQCNRDGNMLADARSVQHAWLVDTLTSTAIVAILRHTRPPWAGPGGRWVETVCRSSLERGATWRLCSDVENSDVELG